MAENHEERRELFFLSLENHLLEIGIEMNR